MYKIKVNNSYTFKVNEEDINTIDSVETSRNNFHILKDNASIDASILQSDIDKKSYQIQVNNNVYDVDINDTIDQLIEELGFEIGSAKKVNEIKAPMPGLILEINVIAGQDVKENDPLLILEAMKMENVINSPRDGVIKSISVEKGNTVDKNALLIEFE